MIMVGCPVNNREEYVEEYLNGILGLQYPKKEIRLVFLLNNVTDNTAQIFSEYQLEFADEYHSFELFSTNLLKPGEKGLARNYDNFAKIRNAWVDLRKDEDYIFSVDSDVVLPEDSLSRLIKHDKDICSILINNAPEEYQIFNILHEFKEDRYRHIFGFMDGLIEVDVTGAAYLIKSKVFDYCVEYGYHRQGEDVYFCKEAKERNFNIFCDTSIRGKHLKRFNYV